MKKSLLVMFSVTLFFMLSMNAIAQTGKHVKVANNQELIDAYYTPGINTIALEGGYYDFLVESYPEGTILFISPDNKNGSRDTCDYIISPTDKCFPADSTEMHNIASANTSGSIPPCPFPNNGQWSYVDSLSSGLVTFIGATNNYDCQFRVDDPGVYTLKYEWTNGAKVQAEYLFYPEPTNLTLTSDSPICEVSTGASIDWDYSVGSDPTPNLTVSWYLNDVSIIGPNTTTPGNWTLDSTTSNGELTDCGIYELKVEVFNGECNAITDSIDIDFRDEPTVYAGKDDTTCSLTYQIYPSSSASCWNGSTPTTAWTKITGPGTGTVNANDYAEVTECGLYEFEIAVSNGPCVNYDTIAIYFADTPYNVDAGADDEVCGLDYILTPTYDIDCPPLPVETDWTKVSGPGTVSFIPISSTEDSAHVTECGTYEFAYHVYSYPCDTVTDTIQIKFYDTPTIYFSGQPDTVCGYESPEFYGTYDYFCDNGGTIDTSWTVVAVPPATGSGYVIDVGGGPARAGGQKIIVDDCGEYDVTLTVVNGPCTADSTFRVMFHEIPDVTIDGDLDVYACETVTYEAIDNRVCDVTPLAYLWEVWNGTINGADDQSTVSVTWDNDITTPGSIKVTVSASGVDDCDDTDSKETTETNPTLEGQVKYWNQFETYMPTPFPTSINGTYPEDYFYVELYEGTTLIGDEEIVQIYLDPTGGTNSLESYFGFTLPVLEWDCDADFNLKIWDGGYLFDPNFPGNGFNEYLGANYTYNNWGGVNATDALAILKMATDQDVNSSFPWVGLQTDDPEYGFFSFNIADVNGSDNITALDALTANKRVLDLLAKYPAPGDTMYGPNFSVAGRFVPSLPYTTWDTYLDTTSANSPVYNDVPFTHSAWDYMYYSLATEHKYTSVSLPWEADSNYINIYYEAEGDINASYVPTTGGFKAAPNMSLIYENEVYGGVDDIVSIPVTLDNETQIGALTLNLDYNNELIEVLGVNYGEEFYNINHEEGTVKIAWFAEQGVTYKSTSPVAVIRVKVLANIPEGTRLFELSQYTELADISAQVIEGVNFKSLSLTSDADAIKGLGLEAKNYPNPFNNHTNISYVLPEAGQVQLVVFNKLGQVVETIVDQTQEAGQHVVEFNRSNLGEGVYFYRITLEGVNGDYTVTNNMVVMD